METQADHGAITDTEAKSDPEMHPAADTTVQAAVATTAAAGMYPDTVAERKHCTAYIKKFEMFAKAHNAKELSMWRHSAVSILISACLIDGSSEEVFSILKANLLQSDATGSLSIMIECSAYWHSIVKAVVRAKAVGRRVANNKSPLQARL